MANEKNQLAGFDFDTEETFFGLKTEEGADSQTSAVIKEVTAEGDDDEVTNLEKEKAGEKKPEEGEKEEEHKFFGEGEEEPVTDEKKKTEEKPSEEKPKTGEKEKPVTETPKGEAFFTQLTLELKEKGLFSTIELKEGENITEEQFFENYQKDLEAIQEEGFKGFFEELDQDGIDFLKYKKDGGDTHKFVAMAQSSLSLQEFDETNPQQVQQVLTHYFTKFEGTTDAEELKDKLEWLKESGKDKAYAAKYFDSIRAKEKKEREDLLKAQEDTAKQKVIDTKAFSDAIDGILATTPTVGVFSLTEKDKKELGSYINKNSVKVGKNKYVPQFNIDLQKVLKAATPEDKAKLVALAKVLKEDFKPDITTKVKTEVTKNIKSKLQEAKENGTVKGTSIATGGTGKSLGDYF